MKLEEGDGAGWAIHKEQKEVIIAESQQSGGLKVEEKQRDPESHGREQQRKNATKRDRRVGPKPVKDRDE